MKLHHYILVGTIGTILIVLLSIRSERQSAEPESKTKRSKPLWEVQEPKAEPSNEALGELMPEQHPVHQVFTPEQIAELEAAAQVILDEAARIRAERSEHEKYLESRSEWRLNFPFDIKYHPTITFDPEVLDPPVDEFGWPIENERYKEMQKLVKEHGFLYDFHINTLRYTPEFEQMHYILLDAGLEPDPIRWGQIFTTLQGYHDIMQADPNQDAGNMLEEEYSVGDMQEVYWESIVSHMTYDRKGGKGFDLDVIPREHAEDARERLINEIPAEGFLKMDGGAMFAYHHQHEEELKAGDKLMIP